MKHYKYLGYAMMAAGMLVATSCSDFSDYNEAKPDSTPSGNLTLWENISQTPQLSDFAALVKRVGFDKELGNTRYFTVWAPVNGSFSRSDLDAMNDSLILAQFIKSHVAEYGHAATGILDERIHTLNDKSFTFAGSGNYTFDGVGLSATNLPSINGLMHLLNGTARFFPNIYEYIFMADGIDSLRAQFLRYQQTTLDQDASIKGPMVNGVQTYIDSVLVTRNTLTAQLNAQIANEDSSYTFLMPTNNAFRNTYDRIKSLYKFITTTTVQDPENFTKAGDTKTKSVTVDAEYMSDSLTRRVLFNDLAYSNTNMYNQWIVGKGHNADTIRSTTRNKFSNPKDIIEKYMVGQPVEMSNGYVRIVDSLAFYPWESFNPEISVNPRNNLACLFPAGAQAYRNQSIPDSLLSQIFGEDVKRRNYNGYRYMWIDPGGDRAKPDFNIMLPGVLATTYNIYVVFLPSAMRLVGNDPRPNKLNFELTYCNESGTVASYKFSNAIADSIRSGGELPKQPTALNMNTSFENDPEKLDSVFIGQFTFPVAYNGLGDYAPNIRITSPISVFSNDQLATYTRDVRIAAIVLKPLELEEFEANKK